MFSNRKLSCLVSSVLFGVCLVLASDPVKVSSDYRQHILHNVLRLKLGEGQVADQGPAIVTFLDNYGVGIDAYLQNDYEGCVHHMEIAIQGYHEYYDTVARCRASCETERNNRQPLYPDNPEHLHFFEGVIAKTICLKRCQGQQLTNVPKYFAMDEWHKTQFETRAPYEYLQLCYYRQNEIVKAIQATYTVLVVRPNDHLSSTNMRFYATLPEFNKDLLRDQEEKRFVAPYVDGIVAYDKEDWTYAINLLEKSLELYIDEEQNCRAFCEDGFDQGWFPDFVSSTANHFTFCLRCKMNCTRAMNLVRGERYDDVFFSHYEYLQLSYFKLGDVANACKCTKAYLLFNPKNAMMQTNLEFYLNSLEDKSACDGVRPEAESYFKRFRYETSLLKYVDTEFKILFKELDALP